MSDPATEPAPAHALAGLADRRVVMATSAGEEASLADVVTNLATVCAEIGQKVALLSTAGLASPGAEAELPQSTPLWWKHWPSPENGAGLSVQEEREGLLSGPLKPSDVENLLGETGVHGVSRLDLRYFIGHPAQVVVRVPEVLTALREVVDVVFLEVPSYLSVHHGAGLTPFADVVLVVAERETTTLDDMRRMSAALRHLAAPVVGTALTEGGFEIYDWGRVDSELQEADETEDDEREPTEQLPLSGFAGVDPEPARDELSVVEHVQREA